MMVHNFAFYYFCCFRYSLHIAVRSETQTVRCRPLRLLEVSYLCEQLQASMLCQPALWPVDIDDMAAGYESEINVILV